MVVSRDRGSRWSAQHIGRLMCLHIYKSTEGHCLSVSRGATASQLKGKGVCGLSAADQCGIATRTQCLEASGLFSLFCSHVVREEDAAGASEGVQRGSRCACPSRVCKIGVADGGWRGRVGMCTCGGGATGSQGRGAHFNGRKEEKIRVG